MAAVLLAGCQVDQKKEVDTYRTLLDAAVPPTTQPAGPLTLEKALRLANQSNEQLAVRGEDYLQALINKNRAVANFLPTVSFQPSFAVEETPSGNGAGAPGGGFRPQKGGYSTRLEAPVVGTMNLFRGGGDVANLRFAEYTIEQRKQLLLDAQATVLVNVAQVFYQVLRSERQLDVLKNSLQVQEARVKDEQQKLNNGLSTRLALAQVQAQAANTRATLAQVDGDVLNGRTTLAYLIGQPVDVTPLKDDLAVPKDRPPVAQFEQTGQQQRRDLLAAQAQVHAARAAVDVAISEYYPSVSLNAEGFLYREFYADASRWNAILTANVPLFSAGLIKQDVRTAWSRLRQAALLESDTRRIVQRDIDTAYQNLLTSEQRITDLESEVAAADEALKQAQAAVANNLGIVLDVLTAQDQLLNSQLQLTGARYDRSIFYLDLVRTTGELTVGLPTTRSSTQ